MIKALLTALGLIFLLLAPIAGFAQGRLQVTSIKPLLIAAIDRGIAYGVMMGPAAELIAKQFGSREPIEVTVRAVRPLLAPDCKRLEVKTTQAGVREKGQTPASKELVYQLNYCRDGRFPEDRVGN